MDGNAGGKSGASGRATEPLLLCTVQVSPQLSATGAEVATDLLAAILDSAYRARRKKPAAVDLLVTTDEEIARMNHRHLGKNRPTDVLAFEDGETEDGRHRLGDIAISLDTAVREAGARGIEPRHELAFYALHGLFHLLGMRDGTPAHRRRMHEAQAAAMNAYGISVDERIMDRQEGNE